MEALRCYDSQPTKLIPRFYFTFNEDLATFDYAIPRADIENAKPLKKVPGEIQTKRPVKTLEAALGSVSFQNIAGEISVKDTDDFTTTSMKLQPLPPYDAVDPTIKNFTEKTNAKIKSRIPYYIGLQGIFEKFTGLSELQYQFGVAEKNYDSSMPVAPARFSFTNYRVHFSPITIAGNEFEDTLSSLSNNDVDNLSNVAKDYLKNFDRELLDHSTTSSYRINNLKIGRYGIFSVGTDIAYGHRGKKIYHSDDQSSDIGFRIQSSDVYVAAAHNSGMMHEEIVSMLAVGLINHMTLDRIAPGLTQ